MPLISVIIPVGGAHQQFIPVAVASCIWQSVADWEVIVINDGKNAIPEFADRRVRIIDSPNRFRDTPIGNRAAVARNAGIKVADGEFVVFLDADDYLLPKAFETFIRGQASHNSTYTFSSHYSGQVHLKPPAYSQNLLKEFNIHPITALIPKKALDAVGGFDENAPGWEDWTLYLRLAIAGYCGEYYRGPTFVYQDQHSINHIVDIAGGQELMKRVTAPYRNKNGEIIMAKCCGSNNSIARNAAASLGAIEPQADGTQILEYTGAMTGSSIVRHPVSKRTYKYGGNATVRFMTVQNEDVDFFLSMNHFRVVSAPTHWTPPPAPALQVPVQVEETPVITQQQSQPRATSTLSIDAQFEAMIAAQIASDAETAIIDVESESDDELPETDTPVARTRGRKKRDA